MSGRSASTLVHWCGEAYGSSGSSPADVASGSPGSSGSKRVCGVPPLWSVPDGSRAAGGPPGNGKPPPCNLTACPVHLSESRQADSGAPACRALRHRDRPASPGAWARGCIIKMPGGLVALRPHPGQPASPPDRGGAGSCSRAWPVRRCRSSRHPTAWTPATNDRRGTSSWAGHPSRTTKVRSCATWPPALARPLPARNAIPSTGSPSAREGRRCHRPRVEIAQPPRLGCRLLAQQTEHSPVVHVLSLTSRGQHDRGVSLEDRRDGAGDGPVNNSAPGDPGDLGIGSYTPDPAVPFLTDHW